MTFEIIIFIASVLFGIFWYWKESKDNGVYRAINKIMNAKEVQMKPENKKGFIHKQDLLLRLVYIGLFFLLFLVASMLLVGFSIANVQIYTAMVVGTFIGTYIASAVLFTSQTVEDNVHAVEDVVTDTFEKGKDLLNDLKEKVTSEKEADQKIETPKETKEIKEEKSARERLKDKGLL